MEKIQFRDAMEVEEFIYENISENKLKGFEILSKRGFEDMGSAIILSRYRYFVMLKSGVVYEEVVSKEGETKGEVRIVGVFDFKKYPEVLSAAEEFDMIEPWLQVYLWIDRKGRVYLKLEA